LPAILRRGSSSPSRSPRFVLASFYRRPQAMPSTAMGAAMGRNRRRRWMRANGLPWIRILPRGIAVLLALSAARLHVAMDRDMELHATWRPSFVSETSLRPL